jgi:protein transport protein SEC31
MARFAISRRDLSRSSCLSDLADFCFKIYIWDLANPQKPYSPGARSRSLDDISALAWNPRVPHVLATASTNGNVVVWDLKNKREVITFSYQQAQGGVSAVRWHPQSVSLLAWRYGRNVC